MNEYEKRKQDKIDRLLERSKEATRKELKANGFRWSPRNGAWQRHRSSTANWKAENILKGLK